MYRKIRRKDAMKEVLYINAYAVFETEWRCGYGCGLYQVCKMLIFFSHQFDTDFAKPPFFSALLLGREEEAVPRGSGNTHPEDLPWLEVPHSFSPVEEEPGGGGRLVPKICGEHHSLHLPQKTFFFFWDQYTELFLVWKCLVVFYCSNKRSTRTSGPLP